MEVPTAGENSRGDHQKQSRRNKSTGHDDDDPELRITFLQRRHLRGDSRQDAGLVVGGALGGFFTLFHLLAPASTPSNPSTVFPASSFFINASISVIAFMPGRYSAVTIVSVMSHGDWFQRFQRSISS